MSTDKIERKDVDNLASQILINLGLLNSAALAAAIGEVDGFNVKPFAIGLICAIFSQLWWYADSALEHALSDKVFTLTTFEEVASFVVDLLILLGGCSSAAFLVVGCFQIMDVPYAPIWGIIICLLPLLTAIFFGIKIYKRL